MRVACVSGRSEARCKGLGAGAPRQRIKLSRSLPAAELDSDATLAPKVKALIAVAKRM
jgi:hypothetical protein